MRTYKVYVQKDGHKSKAYQLDSASHKDAIFDVFEELCKPAYTRVLAIEIVKPEPNTNILGSFCE